MDSGGGTPPGPPPDPPPDPCRSTSAPSQHLPRARTWTAAVSIQSGGEAQHTASWKVYEILISIHKNKKIPPSLLPGDFIKRVSFACITCWPNVNDLLVGCLIDSFPYVCVHLISLYTCFPCFLCLCVCGCGWRSVVYCRAVSREFLNCVGLNSSFLLQSAASFLQAPLKIFYTQMRILKLPSKKKEM